MEIIKKETVEALLKGSESVAKVAGQVSNDLMNEAIGLFIVNSVLSILRVAVVFIIFYIVKRYLDAISEGMESKMIRAAKTTALILSLIFFTTQSFPHIVDLSKALVAPKIFLAEKALELAGK